MKSVVIAKVLTHCRMTEISAPQAPAFRHGEYVKPCTASGIIELINSTEEDIDGKHAVVIGRSNIVGKPVAEMLLNNQYQLLTISTNSDTIK